MAPLEASVPLPEKWGALSEGIVVGRVGRAVREGWVLLEGSEQPAFPQAAARRWPGRRIFWRTLLLPGLLG